MTQSTSSLTAGTTLARVRGWLLDVDGVLHVGSQPIPGAAELLEDLVAREIPFRLLTNTTTASRATLASRLRAMGLPVTEESVDHGVDGDRRLRAPALPGGALLSAGEG